MFFNVIKNIKTSVRAILVLTVLTGVIYPLLVTVIAQLIFPNHANGSLLKRDGLIVGSALIAQKFSDPAYFHSRPSAGDYATVPSAASNLGPTSSALKANVEAQRLVWGADAPSDLLTTSASGLDPHLSPEGALFQIERIAAARGFGDAQKAELRKLVYENSEQPQFGLLGMPRTNVLLLNLQLKERFP